MKKNILIAPLNWGLGHASRCVPIINGFLALGHHVILASDGDAKKMLEKEFPSLIIESLPSYNITYPKNEFFAWHMAKKLPSILAAIKQEHQLLKKLIVRHNLNVVVSDNRYGMYSDKVKSIIITHQLQLKAPVFEKMISNVIQNKLLNFDVVWVPDVENENNLSGELSHGDWSQIDPVYIGGLSRMTEISSIPISNDQLDEGFILAIISGPEPQRTKFEKIIFEQAKELNEQVVIVGGSFAKKETTMKGNILSIPFAKSGQIKWLIQKSNAVVSRSGYSTIMDLCALKKCAILVPTPGQTEQEYLVRHLKTRNIFVSQNQFDFDLQKALTQVNSLHWNWEFNGLQENTQLKEVLTHI
ncbi:MAG: glycosyltransferase [Salibacteraceae bacterium]